jgi:hypothetical protein
MLAALTPSVGHRGGTSMPWFDILAVAICFAAMAALIAVAVAGRGSLIITVPYIEGSYPFGVATKAITFVKLGPASLLVWGLVSFL